MRIKNIALGTVQFGVAYGVSNKFGKTCEKEAKRMLDYAYKHGIDMLDTAPSYGNSEDVIGRLLYDCSEYKYQNIVTKTPNFNGGVIGDKQIEKLIKSFELSQKKLKQKTMYGLLVHSCDDIFSPGGEKLLQAMEILKKNGVVKKIGVSVYNGEQIDKILNDCHIDFIQLPISVLDQRLIAGGQLKRLKDLGVEIHARSVFLQGLLLMPLNEVPPWFDPIIEALKSFHIKAEELNISVLQLALSFVQGVNEIDKIVIGANTLDQLDEIVNTELVPINLEYFSNLSIKNSTYLNPSNWEV